MDTQLSLESDASSCVKHPPGMALQVWSAGFLLDVGRLDWICVHLQALQGYISSELPLRFTTKNSASEESQSCVRCEITPLIPTMRCSAFLSGDWGKKAFCGTRQSPHLERWKAGAFCDNQFSICPGKSKHVDAAVTCRWLQVVFDSPSLSPIDPLK